MFKRACSSDQLHGRAGCAGAELIVLFPLFAVAAVKLLPTRLLIHGEYASCTPFHWKPRTRPWTSRGKASLPAHERMI